MKDLIEFESWRKVARRVRGNPHRSSQLLFDAEDIMLDAQRLLSTARAGQDANELAARMNEWVEAWNE